MMRFMPVAVLALLSVSGTVFAQDRYSDGRDGSDAFTGLRGSFAFRDEISAKDTASPPNTIKAHTKVGGGGSVYWGWRLPYGFKTELELLYRYQPLSSASLNGVSGSIEGYVQTFAPMVNAYWNIPVGDIGFHPFIGAGVGYAWNEAGLSSIAGISFPTVHDDKWRLAYNAMAGVSVPFGQGARLTGMYRWLHEDIDIACTGVTCGGHSDSHSVDLGIEFDL